MQTLTERFVRLLNRRWMKPMLSGVAVCLISGAVLFAKREALRFHGDESGWIASGIYYSDLVRTGNLDREKWECPKCDGWGSLNMHVGEWLIGVPLILNPQTRAQWYSRYYIFNDSYKQNLQNGRVPPRETLMFARSISAVFGALCCGLVFAIGYLACNTVVGLLASALVLFNPVFLDLAPRAMTDVYYNFFLLCFCLAVILFFKAPRKQQALLVSCCCGVLAGLACSVKVTGILVSGALFSAVAIERFHFVSRHKSEPLIQLAIFSICALTVIYGLNPVFWPSLKELRSPASKQELKSLTADVANSKRIPAGVRERYPHLGTLARVLEFPRLFGRWNQIMTWQRDHLASASWHGNRVIALNRAVFLKCATFPGEFLFFGMGLVYLISKYRCRLFAFSNADSIPLQFWLINYLLILLFLKLNWNRYFLPTLIGASFVAAVGMYAVVVWISNSRIRLIASKPAKQAANHSAPQTGDTP